MTTGAVDASTTEASRPTRDLSDHAPLVLWQDGAHTPAENMRRDTALLEAAEHGAAKGEPRPPILRLFRFAPHGVTLGSSQRAGRALDLDALEADGIPWAVRPTGGRAIFHAQEWTYSMTVPIADPVWGGSLGQACDRISDLVAASLQRLGVPVSVMRVAVRFEKDHATPQRPAARPAASDGVPSTNPACFASTARHEIVLGGRKLAGSAQRRTAHALLQQGSILLGDGHLRLVDYLLASRERRDSLRHSLASTSCHAGPYLRHTSGLAAWANALMEELPSGTRRMNEEGGQLLTLSEAPFYTSHSPYRENTAL